MLVRSLIMPCLAWAAGFARPTMEDINAVRNEVRFLFSAGFGGDVATVAFYELLGWGLEPSFALDLGLCKLCWRWVSKPPPWQEELPITFLPGQWHTGLPEVVTFLAKTGWWFNRDATTLCRRDAEGALRQVRLGLESFRTIQGWLEDFYRSRYLLRCQRLVRKLHRTDDDDLAVGLNLEASPVGFRVQFQGHRAALLAALSPYARRAAFLSGGTAWFCNAAAPPDFQKDRCKCLCGKTLPSRSHLLWVCPCTQDLRIHLEPPKHRGEERLPSKHRREKPLAPPGIDHTGLRDDISEAICLALRSQPSIVVATDGSAKDDVAGYSVVVDDPSNHFAGGDDAEDQTPFRAEVCALQLALEALCQAAAWGASGHVTVVVDCSAALGFTAPQCRLQVDT
eukprot:s905_g23.t2